MRSTSARFLLRMNAQFVPRRFREVHVVVACSFLDVGEGQSAISIGDVDDLIESRDRITDMLGVDQWLFALLRKCVDAVGQVAVRRQPPMFLVRLPSCFRHITTILSPNTWIEGKRCGRARFSKRHSSDRTGSDWAITPEVLRRINWTMVSATPLYWASWNEVRPSLFPYRDRTSLRTVPVCNDSSVGDAEVESTLRGTARALSPSTLGANNRR